MLKKYFVMSFILLLLFIPSISANNKVAVSLNKCIDGDTADFNLNGEIVKVRFLAIDTPEYRNENNEINSNGQSASNYTCERLTNAKKIKLEYDDNSDAKDKYGRTLAWVWVDNSLIQEELIEQGLAKIAYLYGDYKYLDELRNIEQKAKTEKKGIWADKIDESSTLTIEQLMSIILCVAIIIMSLIIKVIKK